MNWLILTIISASAFSVSRILQKILLKGNGSDSFAFSFVFPVFVSIAIFSYILLTNSFELPNLSAVWQNVVLMIILYGVGSVCIYQAYKESPASEISIIFASSSAWAVVSAVIFLGEKLTIQNIFGVIAIILGIIVINYQQSNWKLERGHLYALVAAFMFGTAFTNDALILHYYKSTPSYILLAFILPALAILVYKPTLVKSISYYFSKDVFWKLLLTASIYAISSITIFTAYTSGGKASAISPIHQSNIILTVILSYFLLKEKDKPTQKILGSILVFVGAILLI